MVARSLPPYFQGSGLPAASVCGLLTTPFLLPNRTLLFQAAVFRPWRTNQYWSKPIMAIPSLCQGLASTNSCDTVCVNEKKERRRLRESFWKRAYWWKRKSDKKAFLPFLFLYMAMWGWDAWSCWSLLANVRLDLVDSSEMAEKNNRKTLGSWWHDSWKSNSEITHF